MNKQLKSWSFLLGVGATLLLSNIAQAATKTWNNPAGGRWDTATNWTPVGAPVNGDDVNITLNGTYTVNYVPAAGNTNFASLNLGAASGTQTLTNFSFALNVTGVNTINANGVLTNNANLGGAGTISNSGTINYTGGTIAPGGDLTVNGSGTLVLSGSTKSLQRNLTNNGTVTWPTGAGSLNLVAGVAIVNNSTFSIATNAPITRSTVGANPTITNNGTFTKSGGGTTQLSNVNFINAGADNLVSGTLSTTGTYTQNSGSTNLIGGSLASTMTVGVAGGLVTGGGTIGATVSNTGGTIAPGIGAGATATLNVTGSYNQSAGGSYNVDINGPTASTQYDVLTVSGPATLAGALNANVTFSPASGTFFQVLNYSSRSGVFAPVTVTGASLDTQYNATNLRLIVATLTATITTPQDGTFVNAPAAIRGVFTRNPGLNGNTGLQSVDITLVENETGLFYNGSSFQAAPATFAALVDPATGAFGTNNGPGTAKVTDGNTYTLTATATDTNGNTVTSPPVTVTVDRNRPDITANNAPVDKSTIMALPPSITGTATDSNSVAGTSSGIRDVRLFLRRSSDGFYWNGSTWQAAFVQLVDASATTAPNSGASTNYSVGPLPTPGPNSNTDLTNGLYLISIVSYDNVGNNSGAGSVTRSFFVENSSPPPSALRSAPATAKSPSGGSS